MSLEKYHSYILIKTHSKSYGFDPVFMPDYLFDFQKYIVDWSLRKGRALISADCGLGKSIIELIIAQNVIQKTNKNILLITPLAVNHQFIQEANKFGIIDIRRSNDGNVKDKITITNYEQLHKFNPNDFELVICDESGIIKNFSGKIRDEVVKFMRKVKYRILATATASPNDYPELGNSSEALGGLGFTDMLSKYFKNDNNNVALRRMYGEAQKFNFKGKAEDPFWKWVASWCIACRKPSDLGFDDNGFILPELIEKNHLIEDINPNAGMLFNFPAHKLDEQREENKRTLQKRCEKVAELVSDTGKPAFIGCHLNPEGKLLKQLIPDSIEISGSDSDEQKEEKFISFVNGESRVLITKPKIGAWGLNFQHCSHVVYFVAHCYDEKTEILTKRGWLTFGQLNNTDLVSTVNPKTLEFEWQKPIEIIWQYYEGEMIDFSNEKNKGIDLLVTPNHRMFVKKCPIRFNHNKSFDFKYAKDLQLSYKRQKYRMLSVPKYFKGQIIKEIVIPKYICKVSESNLKYNKKGDKRGLSINSRNKQYLVKNIGSIETKKFMKIAGWFLSEGNCGIRNGKPDGQIRITQTDINMDNRNEIIDLLKSIEELNVYHKTKDIRCCSIQLATFLIDNFGNLSQDKKIPEWVKELDHEYLVILRDTMLKGDGCSLKRGEYKRSYRTISEQLANDFIEICIKTGIRPTIRKRKNGGNSKYKNNEFYEVNLTWKRLNPSIYVKPNSINYKGMIGCVKVENGLLVVRRNNVPIVCGNSYEQEYQFVRRCWRFGQKSKVTFDRIYTEGLKRVMDNVIRKAKQADRMFENLIKFMHKSETVNIDEKFDKNEEVPKWL